MDDTPTGMDDADATPSLATLRERIARGDYRIDPKAVADAVLRRARELARLREQNSIQNECSKPASDCAASVKPAPGSPLVTRPIQVIRTGSFVLASFASISLRPQGGAQTQSS